LETELRALLRWRMNKIIDEKFHPQNRILEDFLAHYIVERTLGLPDEVIVRKALKYYRWR